MTRVTRMQLQFINILPDIAVNRKGDVESACRSFSRNAAYNALRVPRCQDRKPEICGRYMPKSPPLPWAVARETDWVSTRLACIPRRSYGRGSPCST